MSKLIQKLTQALEIIEADIHHNEEFLKMRIDGYEAIQDKVIKILKRDDITNDEKVETLKNFFMI